MILHLNGSALTVWAKNTTDRQVTAVPQIWQQDALPSYYSNADEEVPRPKEETLQVVDAVTARMFGTKKMNEEYFGKIMAMGNLIPENVWTREGGKVPDVPSTKELLATFVYSDSDIKLDTEGGKISVEPKPGVTPLRKVTFMRELEGKKVPVYLLTKSSFDDVYKGASEKRLPAGEFLRVVSPEVYQVWNPLFVLIFTPLIVTFFARRVAKGKPISTARKIFYGMLLTAGAMLIMAIAGFMSDGGAIKVMGLWLVMSYAVITIGELCLSPMGLSLVTKLAPKRLVGLMMGGWFLATAFGNKLSGFFGAIQASLSPSVFFLILTACALAVAMFIYFLLGMLEKAISQYEG